VQFVERSRKEKKCGARTGSEKCKKKKPKKAEPERKRVKTRKPDRGSKTGTGGDLQNKWGKGLKEKLGGKSLEKKPVPKKPVSSGYELSEGTEKWLNSVLERGGQKVKE